MYLLVHYLCDNMCYACLPSKLDKKIHSGAVNQVMAAPILCLFCLMYVHSWLLFFSTVRYGFSAATSMFTFVVLIITIIICLSHVCFGHFKYLSAHNYKIDSQEIDGMENGRPACTSAANKLFPLAQQMYIPQVLQDPNSEEGGSGSGEDDGQGSS
ncbi:CSC1-like protein 2 [Gouania willdenowi]|uniref:CSC1-like protein 2 n=1 Tax=Gouania willdenowi TaxID=441366 RepID=UPI0010546991|nr:CSC1-like protein 2 [Gouania willdenowi]